MNPQAFLREGFQSSTELFKMHNELIQRALHESAVNEYFIRLQMCVLELHFNLNQFNHLLIQLADVIGWDANQRSLINDLLTQYNLPQVL